MHDPLFPFFFLCFLCCPWSLSKEFSAFFFLSFCHSSCVCLRVGGFHMYIHFYLTPPPPAEKKSDKVHHLNNAWKVKDNEIGWLQIWMVTGNCVYVCVSEYKKGSNQPWIINKREHSAYYNALPFPPPLSTWKNYFRKLYCLYNHFSIHYSVRIVWERGCVCICVVE